MPSARRCAACGHPSNGPVSGVSRPHRSPSNARTQAVPELVRTKNGSAQQKALVVACRRRIAGKRVDRFRRRGAERRRSAPAQRDIASRSGIMITRGASANACRSRADSMTISAGNAQEGYMRGLRGWRPGQRAPAAKDGVICSGVAIWADRPRHQPIAAFLCSASLGCDELAADHTPELAFRW
jgi:hypothetical protein